ncbi:hypothetical protein H632_c1930p1 [Helicosporidium sp. ATCC 50920]|nr:hypothetical protein H632_c1930p1 [Helicosporidium sp. ATCC 50920]|eukprot:KDD73684.1 hypothetical protein H632_c1930p1 [Helicosporidium sp. ATCC 50920]
MEVNPLCPQLPIFDLGAYLSASERSSPDMVALCEALARCLHETSALVIRDPRVHEADNKRFLSTMERYFSQSEEAKLQDVRPELHHQVGATPGGVEKPRFLKDAALQARAAALPPESRPVPVPGADVKWRFFWRAGPRPEETSYAELNAPAVIPAAFPDWADVMDAWAEHMLRALRTVADMAALGLGLEPQSLSRLLNHAPHLLAPTGTDLLRHGRPGAVFAGYHADLNFLTIHGRARFPGLRIWLRSGERVEVRVPQDCLLLQVGKQLEWVTGGHLRAGYHEVVWTEALEAALEAAKKAHRCFELGEADAAGPGASRHDGALAPGPLWRVSSTLFGHAASDAVLRPLGVFGTPQALREYPPTPAGEQVRQELEAIALKV